MAPKIKKFLIKKSLRKASKRDGNLTLNLGPKLKKSLKCQNFHGVACPSFLEQTIGRCIKSRKVSAIEIVPSIEMAFWRHVQTHQIIKFSDNSDDRGGHDAPVLTVISVFEKWLYRFIVILLVMCVCVRVFVLNLTTLPLESRSGGDCNFNIACKCKSSVNAE